MSCLKKLEEKGFLCSVNIATWSEKMDLLAVGFSSGEFSLFRLSWHKVWHCNAPSPNCGAVTSISWRVSDSRVIAVAFEKTSQIVIVDINSSHCVHRLMLTEIPKEIIVTLFLFSFKKGNENVLSEKVGGKRVSL